MPDIDLALWLQEPITDPKWIVKGVLPAGSLAILAGEAGSGKTMLCYHMAMCTVNGLPFLGHYPTVPTRILYVDEENGKPDSMRYWQWVWRGLGCPPLEKMSAIKFSHFDLGQAWEARVRQKVAEFKPGLIIIDTASPALRVLDENDNAEATLKINALRAIQQMVPDSSVLVLKHEKTQGEEFSHKHTVRGAKAWLGAVDIVMYHTFPPGQPRKDGLRNTVLHADKPRAFGLRDRVKIVPAWTAEKEPRGLKLTCMTSSAEEG